MVGKVLSGLDDCCESHSKPGRVTAGHERAPPKLERAFTKRGRALPVPERANFMLKEVT